MTSYEWQLLGNYGYGWDLLTIEDTRRAILRQLKVYQENEGGSYRLKRVKVKESN